MTLTNAAELTQDDLAKRVLHDFCPRFAPLGRVVWLSDGGARAAHVDKRWLRRLRLSAADAAKLPNIIVDDPKPHRLWLIDLARSGHPTTAEKRAAMKASLRRADAHVLFVTALRNHRQFPRFISDALWGTVVWFADEPEHVVIFDDAPDPRLLGPSTKRSES
ncbi:MAG TPA: BsuBI/PstI family type II restriction endonuclease [Pirellulales bacterium]|nr:BsuBI/PstI family type II restriction endonuclease [Pirellulales bacterium]